MFFPSLNPRGMHPHTIQTINLKHLRCHLSYTTLCVNMTTNVAQVSVYDLVTSGRDFLAQYKPITKATCISSLVCLFSHVDSRLACAGYLCKVIKSIRVWLRPVRCSTDDKSGSVNRLKLGGGGPDSSPIRLYIHPMSFPITLSTSVCLCPHAHPQRTPHDFHRNKRPRTDALVQTNKHFIFPR